jgi:hypothetical protein
MVYGRVWGTGMGYEGLALTMWDWHVTGMGYGGLAWVIGDRHGLWGTGIGCG